MNIMRNLLLRASQNARLQRSIPKYKFIQKALKRFMPGEHLKDAIEAGLKFQENKIPSIFTHLGENITNLSEASNTSEVYVKVLESIAKNGLNTEISIKLTSIGLDLSFDETLENFKKICSKAMEMQNIVWIDMEGSSYTDMTIDFYKKIKREYSNSGICFQSYLYRTKKDLDALLEVDPIIRLVKGAYKESNELAYKNKKEVDHNFFELAKELLGKKSVPNIRAAFATHDEKLIVKIIDYAAGINLSKDQFEIQMLYGIRRDLQYRLADEGYKIKVLISYGEAWFPWYMRRLAERPANVGFVLKNIFS